MKMCQRNCAKKFREFWTEVTESFLLLILRLIGGMDVVIVYVTLILKGAKKYSEVFETLKPQVRQMLITLDCEELIDE